MIVLAPDFMTKICKKAAQDFHCAVSEVFDRVKSVALWSANIRNLAKNHKSYGSAASWSHKSTSWTWRLIFSKPLHFGHQVVVPNHIFIALTTKFIKF